MTRDSIGADVAGRLYAAEAAIDVALAETASLVAMLPAARSGAHLSAVTGQRAFDGVAASIQSLAQARSHIVDTHNTLAALARKMGLDVLAVGPLDKPEDSPPRDGSGGIHAFGVVNKTLPSFT
jgi:hypothetical protein